MNFNPLSVANFDLVSYHDQREKSEIREDPEKQVALEKILELFNAAGYFRARITALTPFDKVGKRERKEKKRLLTLPLAGSGRSGLGHLG